MRCINTYIRVADKGFSLGLAKGLARDGPNLRIFIEDPGTKAKHNEECIVIKDRVTTGDSNGELAFERIGQGTSTKAGSLVTAPKYADTRVIAGMVEEIYGKSPIKQVITGAGVDLKTVYFTGLTGGCGTTAAVLTTASLLYEIYGSRCLTVDLSMNSGSGKYTGILSDRNLQEFLYFAKRNRAIPLSKYITSEDGFDHLKIPFGMDVSMEELKLSVDRLIEQVSSAGRYEFIIFDMGSQLSKSRLSLISSGSCSVVTVNENDEEIESVRFKESAIRKSAGIIVKASLMSEASVYRETMGHRNSSEDAYNDSEADISSSIGEADIGDSELRVRIKWDPASFIRSDGMIRIDRDGLYGASVSELARMVFDASFTGKNKELLQ